MPRFFRVKLLDGNVVWAKTISEEERKARITDREITVKKVSGASNIHYHYEEES